MLGFMRYVCVGMTLFAWACDKTNFGTDGGNDGLIKHEDVLGFSIKHEPGWQVSFQKGAYIQIVKDDGKSRGIVFPFLAKGALTAEKCLEDAATTFADLMPNASVVMKRQTKQQPDEAIAEFNSSAGNALGLCSMDGVSGVLYLAITPDGVRSNTMNRIIASFKTLTFDEPGKTAVDTDMTDWLDPKENAFRIKVPKGWKVEGGLFRGGTVDVRLHIRMTSPDKEITIGFGDKDLPKYSTAVADGTVYNPGYGNVLIGKRLVSGGEYAQEYATTNAEILGCPGAQAVGRELDDKTAGMERVSIGDAKVTCTRDGKEYVGYVVARLKITQAQDGTGNAVWEAEMSGFSAPKARESEALNIAIATYRSYQTESAWAQAQQATTIAAAGIVAKTSNDIGNLISKQYAKTQVVMDRVFRNWSNATLGQTDVADVTTGETYKIASGKNYYWRKAGTNVVAGTNQYERPEIDFTPLVEY